MCVQGVRDVLLGGAAAARSTYSGVSALCIGCALLGSSVCRARACDTASQSRLTARVCVRYGVAADGAVRSLLAYGVRCHAHTQASQPRIPLPFPSLPSTPSPPTRPFHNTPGLCIRPHFRSAAG